MDTTKRHSTPTRWQRVLYKKQPYPDNHTDDTFLEHMRLNTHTQSYNYFEALHSTGSIGRHLSIITVYVSVFVYMMRKDVSAEELLAVVFVLAAVLYGLLSYFRYGFADTKQYPVAGADPIAMTGSGIENRTRSCELDAGERKPGPFNRSQHKPSEGNNSRAVGNFDVDSQMQRNFGERDPLQLHTAHEVSTRGSSSESRTTASCIENPFASTTYMSQYMADNTHHPVVTSIQPEYDLLASAKTFVLLLLLLLGVSPVLTTLTASVSTDSIYGMAAFMFMLNVVRTDYRVHGSDSTKTVPAQKGALVAQGSSQPQRADDEAEATYNTGHTAYEKSGVKGHTRTPGYKHISTRAATTGTGQSEAPLTRTHLSSTSHAHTGFALTPSAYTPHPHIQHACVSPAHKAQAPFSVVLPELSLAGINEAMFASVCLASRLHSALEGFALLAFAVEVFVLLPYVVRSMLGSKLAEGSAAYSHSLTTLVVLSTFLLLVPIASMPALLTYVCAMSGITFVTPALLIRAQKYKRQIVGPWDEAVVTNIDDT
ncbi:hypothetical protein SARC_02893 [Sphaeroforma arctica JP610]|uniref:Uncharacterized protein n=1 Tax=Sphaeroforma arctica JP610 TaxID=667725 RepID=A0A0L0G7Q0_9EUKA|nr:hypothetical protein SARC_02893 [Sphaeroforma arctica JP610]KNC84911.1 hypothetical protein SARC_02893 [Sphaeroforma arctica JP610]|eukprot:XP_014158813.1 hypothetical protein SARC_02893 [Sphaeroforma arctica JP610]